MTNLRRRKNGAYDFHKRYPTDLTARVGKTHFTKPLGTTSHAEAKRLEKVVALEFDVLCERLRREADLPPPDVAALVQGVWSAEVAEMQRRIAAARRPRKLADGLDAEADVWRDALRDGDWSGEALERVNGILGRAGIDPSSAMYLEARRAVARTLYEALMQGARWAASEEAEPFKALPQAAPAAPVPATRTPAKPAPISEVIAAWAAERKPVKKTVDEFTRKMAALRNHVGHNDLARLTEDDVIAWKDALVASGLAPATVGKHLTAIRALCKWAYQNRRIAVDPTANVRFQPKVDPRDRRVSYDDDDAKRILIAARGEKGFKRWVPWLCAFTGARLEEICGAMASDVRQEGDIHYLRISFDDRAGNLKNADSVRDIPLHPAIIAEGFLRYVEKLAKDGPLFPDLEQDIYGSRGGNGSKRIGRWVRKTVGITDKRKAPSHSWRHRMKDELRAAGVDEATSDAITGHSNGSVGRKYGSRGYPLRVLAEAIGKIKSPL